MALHRGDFKNDPALFQPKGQGFSLRHQPSLLDSLRHPHGALYFVERDDVFDDFDRARFFAMRRTAQTWSGMEKMKNEASFFRLMHEVDPSRARHAGFNRRRSAEAAHGCDDKIAIEGLAVQTVSRENLMRKISD